METEVAGEENARGNTDDAAATEEAVGAEDPAGEEAAKAAAAKAGEGSGDRTPPVGDITISMTRQVPGYT